MSEKIGVHKGSLQTLMHEKKELSRLLNIVNSQIERHLSALEEEGVDTEELMKEANNQSKGKNNREKKKGRDQSQRSKRNSMEDTDELLEDDSKNDFGDRDFSPR